MSKTVKGARIDAGLTQQKIAKKLGIDRSTYIRYEKHPELMPLGVAIAIARITGECLDDIFFGLIST